MTAAPQERHSPAPPRPQDLPGLLYEMWRRVGAGQGSPPVVSEFLANYPPQDCAALVAILRVDQQQRWLAGDRVPVCRYFAAYPALCQDADQAVELIYCEFLVREELGDQPVAAEYLEGYPEYREQLGHQLELHAALRGMSSGPMVLTRTGNLPGTVEQKQPPTVISHSPHALVNPQEPAFPVLPGYEIVRELGRGGMGVVFEARETASGRTVALKMMQHAEPAALARFKREFRALADISHRNLVSLYQLVADGPTWFFTMELLAGVPFLAYVRRPRGQHLPLDADAESRLRVALGQLADGVDALHNAGRLHRDIKPGNVLVTHEGRTVLLDFGLAAQMDTTGRYQSIHPGILGTVAYMAPEQAASQPVSSASDWYSVGVMLYEALTGELPFVGPMFRVLMEKQTTDPRPPQELVATLPEDLCRLCMEMLDRDPTSRPSGAEVRQRLSKDNVPSTRGGQDVAFTGSHWQFSVQGPVGDQTRLIGRREQLRRLTAAFEATQNGKTVVVSLAGRSGAGKSALLRAFLAQRDSALAVSPPVVLSGRCYEQESVPYKALDSLVDALSQHLLGLPRAEVDALLPRDIHPLARLFPVLRQIEAVAGFSRRGNEIAEQQEIRRRAIAALREMLARIGDRRPLILAIDDLQWGDEDSAVVLVELLRAPDPPVLLFVVSYRSEESETSPCLLAFRKGLAAETILERHDLAVDPLTEEERKELALSLLEASAATQAATTPDPAQQQRRAEMIARQSGGYPFFIYELARYLRDGTDEAVGAASDAGSLGDVTLNGVLWQRIRRLLEPARVLLQVVAVAGRPIMAKLAFQAAAVEGADLSLPMLRAERLMRTTAGPEGDLLETYHDRVRETVEFYLSDTERTHFHRRLAETLTQVAADPEWLAVHYLGAGEPQTARGHFLRAAERAAQALAFDRSARLYTQALELGRGQTPATEEARLRIRLGEALAGAGQGAAAAREYLAATALAGGDLGAEETLEARRRAALLLLSSGHVDAGFSALREVLSSVGLSLIESPTWSFWRLVWQRLRLLLRGLGYRKRTAAEVPVADLRKLDAAAAAAAGLGMVDTIQGAYFQSLSLLLALRCGEPTRLVAALALEGAHESIGGTHNRKRTTRLIDAAEKLAQELGEPYPLAMVALARGVAAALEGDWPGGQNLCDQAESIFRERCKGVMWELGTVHRFALWPLMYMGQLQELRRRLPGLIKEAKQRDDLYEETNLFLVVRTMVRLADDEPVHARQELREVMGRWSQHGFHVQHMNHLFDEVTVDLYEGKGAAARERLLAKWPLIERSKLLMVQQVRVFLYHLRARAALAASETVPQALREAAKDARRLAREGVAWATALARLLDASGAARAGRREQAMQLLAEAAQRCQEAHMHLYAAVARWAMGGERRREAEAWMREQGVVRSEGMVRLLAPGCEGVAGMGAL